MVRFAIAAVLATLVLCPLVRAQDAAALKAKVEEGRRLVLMREHEEGRVKLAEVIAADPGNFDAHYWLASSYMLKKEMGKAVTSWSAASDAGPTHFIAAFEAGTGHLREQRYAEAVPYLKRAIAAVAGANGLDESEENQKVREFILTPALAEALVASGASDADVQAAADAAMKAYPNSVTSHYVLGRLHERTGDLKTAIGHYAAGEKVETAPPFATAFSGAALPDHRGHCGTKARHLGWTVGVRPGVRGRRFQDLISKFTVDLPKLKDKEAMKQWCFLFRPQQLQPGQPNIHLVDVVRLDLVTGDTELDFICNGANNDVAFADTDGKQCKWGETKAFAAALMSQMQANDYADVKEARPPTATRFGRSKAHYFHFKGKSKGAVDWTTKMRAEGKSVPDPEEFDVHTWCLRGGKKSFFITLKAKGDAYRIHQQELQVLFNGTRFP